MQLGLGAELTGDRAELYSDVTDRTAQRGSCREDSFQRGKGAGSLRQRNGARLARGWSRRAGDGTGEGAASSSRANATLVERADAVQTARYGLE
jgi:hypothetical protein